MGTLPTEIIFYILAAVIATGSILAVTARKMLRAATWLLVVLICTAGLYLILNYHFLAAVQLSIYAGGILILFIFAILLTKASGDEPRKRNVKKIVMALASSLAGIAVVVFVIVKHRFLYGGNTTIVGDQELSMETIGKTLMGSGKYEYLLSFEALSVLLLAAIVGGIIIARKR